MLVLGVLPQREMKGSGNHYICNIIAKVTPFQYKHFHLLLPWQLSNLPLHSSKTYNWIQPRTNIYQAQINKYNFAELEMQKLQNIKTALKATSHLYGYLFRRDFFSVDEGRDFFDVVEGLGVSVNADGQRPLTVHISQRGLSGVHTVCPNPTYAPNSAIFYETRKWNSPKSRYNVQYKWNQCE